MCAHAVSSFMCHILYLNLYTFIQAFWCPCCMFADIAKRLSEDGGGGWSEPLPNFDNTHSLSAKLAASAKMLLFACLLCMCTPQNKKHAKYKHTHPRTRARTRALSLSRARVLSLSLLYARTVDGGATAAFSNWCGAYLFHSHMATPCCLAALSSVSYLQVSVYVSVCFVYLCVNLLSFLLFGTRTLSLPHTHIHTHTHM